jgi:hypothetical protein
MNAIRNFLLLVCILVSLIGLSGCATAEMDADDVAATAAQGLSGQGQLYNEKVMKGSYGSFGNDFQ